MSGGGGSSSGKVNYPNHMKWTHAQWLNEGHTGGLGEDENVILMTYNVVELMNAAIRATHVTVVNSPYNSLTAVDPDGAFFNSGDALSDYTGQSAFKLLQLFLAETPESLYTTYATDAAATAMIAAFSTDLATEYAARILPNINVGYTDLNATMSSAYTIGAAHVAAQQTREVAKFTADIKTRIALQRVQMKMEWRRLLSTLSLENTRLYLAAKHEETEDNADYATKDNLWDLEIYQYGCQVMSSISGASTVRSGGNTKPSVLGGAMSGAAMGAMVGSAIPGVGTAVGAGVGAAIGIASTL